MPPKGCHGHSIRGSGYVKPDAKDKDKDKTIHDDVKKMMDARAQQDARFFPTLPSTALATSGGVATAAPAAALVPRK